MGSLPKLHGQMSMIRATYLAIGCLFVFGTGATPIVAQSIGPPPTRTILGERSAEILPAGPIVQVRELSLDRPVSHSHGPGWLLTDWNPFSSKHLLTIDGQTTILSPNTLVWIPRGTEHTHDREPSSNSTGWITSLFIETGRPDPADRSHGVLVAASEPIPGLSAGRYHLILREIAFRIVLPVGTARTANLSGADGPRVMIVRHGMVDLRVGGDSIGRRMRSGDMSVIPAGSEVIASVDYLGARILELYLAVLR